MKTWVATGFSLVAIAAVAANEPLRIVKDGERHVPGDDALRLGDY